VVGFGMAVGTLPDMDIFFVSGPEALLALHRGFTHALFWQPILVLLAVIPFYIWLCCRKAPTYPLSHQDLPGSDQVCPHYPFGRMYLAALTGAGMHLYLDCMTTFGTMIFLPFSSMRVAFPALFIIDIVLTLPLLVLLILALRSAPDIVPARAGNTTGFAFVSARSQRLARMGLAWILLYPLLCLGMNAALTMRLTPAFAAPQSVSQATLPQATAGRLTLMPEPFSPFVWKAVVDDSQTYRISTLFPLRHLGAPDPEQELRFNKPDQRLYAALIQQTRQNALFDQFRDFAPLMVQVERPAIQSGDQELMSEYAFMDLRYVTPPKSPARWFGRTEPVFILEARVNASGTLLAYRLLRRNHDAGHTPWVIIEH